SSVQGRRAALSLAEEQSTVDMSIAPITSSALALPSGGAAAANHAPSGTDKTVGTLEDTAYTFSVADFGFSDPDEDWVVGPAPTVSNLAAANVLVLYNTASAEGQQIANYYASVHPGVTLLGLNGINPSNEDVTADFYLSTIRPQ